jgi:ferredoxin-NADP reductase
MAVLKKGVAASARRLGDVLAILRLLPEEGSPFPPYRPGQYIALRREDCRLTKRVVDEQGRVRYVPDVDEAGRVRRGPVTHSYSISSAPFETAREGHLEFYVVLERDGMGALGRLTESLFGIEGGRGEPVGYYDRIAGDFTLERRAASYRNVLLVGTGTGVAPFVSMIKQLHHEAKQGRAAPARYTLVYANRTPGELAYHEELSAIAASGLLDFVYVPCLSRPGPEAEAQGFGAGRANNVLRHIFGLPLKEEEDLQAARAAGADTSAAEEALRGATPPRLPRSLDPQQLGDRLEPASTVALACGNTGLMAEVKRVTDRLGIRFEKEDWKPSRAAEA